MRKIVVGLTGGIGSGKSTVAALFETLEIDVFDTDLIAREVVSPHTEALKAITEKCGPSILTPQGELDRKQLRDAVFQNHTLKEWIENLLHPLIRKELADKIKNSQSPYCVAIVPLLIEKHPYPMVDQILVVDCEESLQQQRASARDGVNKESIEAIMAKQATRAERLALADDVIHNDGSLMNLKKQVLQLHEKYIKMTLSASEAEK